MNSDYITLGGYLLYVGITGFLFGYLINFIYRLTEQL